MRRGTTGRAAREEGQTGRIGALHVVATPIGNLGDITARAVAALSLADIVAAEDTRRTRQLLTHLGLAKRLLSYREHNRRRAADSLIREMLTGKVVALVTDAGTPGLSDPGHYLVRESVLAGISVTPVPGPCALIAAVSASGLPFDRFVFEGFLPTSSHARRARLEELARSGLPLAFYESPQRAKATLEDMLVVLGDRQAALAREITKVYEEFLRGTISGIIDRIGDRDIRGEVTILVEGAPAGGLALNMGKAVSKMRGAGLSASQTAGILAELTGADRREIYRLAAEKKEKEGMVKKKR